MIFYKNREHHDNISLLTRFGFVEMGSVRGAERAVKGLDGTQVWGKQVFGLVL